MNELSSRARAALWWIVPLAILLAVIGWETDWGREVEKIPHPPEAVAPQPVPTSLLAEYSIAGGAATRSETVSRTLFNPTRRAAPALAAESAATKMQRGQFTLTGTTVVDGKSAAFLREASGKSRRVQAGESINGLLVAEVKADRVKLTMGDESEELMLRVISNPRVTASPPVAVVPGAIPQPGVATAQVPPPAAGATALTAEQLAERRRAARAASGQPQPPVPPAPGAVPTPVPAMPVAPAEAGAAPAAPTTPDPRWAEIYKRYQQQQR